MNELNTQCPWSNFTRGNFPLCEEALCAWIKQPANAYSNLIFFIVGFYLLYAFFKKQNSHGLGLGLCIIFIGCASFIAHSSGTKLFGFFDFAAIFTAFSYYAAINTGATVQNRLKIFSAYFFPAVTLLYLFSFLREAIFAAFVIGLIYSEYHLLKKEKTNLLNSSFRKVILTFLVGTIFLALDSKKIICDPHNHYFQMHAIWHICDAVSLFFLAKHLDKYRPLKIS